MTPLYNERIIIPGEFKYSQKHEKSTKFYCICETNNMWSSSLTKIKSEQKV